MTQTENTEKVQEVYQFAAKRYSDSPDWATFYREILGLNGIVRRSFSTREALIAFEQTEEYGRIQQMLTRLREGSVPPESVEPTRVITVRLPKSLHEALRVEAHEHRTSMNKLCISKLLQFIANEKIPAER